MESEKHTLMVRIMPDAVVGAGLVLRQGEVVPAHLFEAHLDSLLRSGAIEWVSADASSISLR